jgi:hypothetical protein
MCYCTIYVTPLLQTLFINDNKQWSSETLINWTAHMLQSFSSGSTDYLFVLQKLVHPLWKPKYHKRFPVDTNFNHLNPLHTLTRQF